MHEIRTLELCGGRTVTSSLACIFGSAPVEEHEEVVHGLF